jgi:hypothetical protein
MIIETTPGLSNPHREPCTVCGEETAEGSPLFFDRHVVDDPGMDRHFLCSICVAWSRRKRGRRLEDPMWNTASNGLGVGVILLTHG